MTTKLAHPLYRVDVEVTRLTRKRDLDEEDRENPLLRKGGAVRYLVAAPDADIAADAALDAFHDEIAVSNLDDFDISASTPVLLSNHEQLDWIAKNQGLIQGDGIEVFDLSLRIGKEK
jgi:hypothetical protein